MILVFPYTQRVVEGRYLSIAVRWHPLMYRNKGTATFHPWEWIVVTPIAQHSMHSSLRFRSQHTTGVEKALARSYDCPMKNVNQRTVEQLRSFP